MVMGVGMMVLGTIRNVQIVEHLGQLRVLIVMGQGEFENLEIGGLRRKISPQEIKGMEGGIAQQKAIRQITKPYMQDIAYFEKSGLNQDFMLIDKEKDPYRGS